MLKKNNIKKIFVIMLPFIIAGTIFSGTVSKGYDPLDITLRTLDNQEILDMVTIQVYMSHQSVLGQLIDHGITILDTRDSKIKALVTQEQLKWLHEIGLNPEVAQEDPFMLGERDVFHSYQEMTNELHQIAASYSNIARLIKLGTSVQGRVIWGLKITDNPEVEENEPEFRILGLHHGNEHMSAEVPFLMCWYLVENYGIDPFITELVDEQEIWIIPMLNPDGKVANSRYNANGVDLNRDYGYVWGYLTPGPFSQPETTAVRYHALDNNFGLSLAFHCSGNIVNYCWDYKPQPTPDDDLIVQLSEAYAAHNGYWVVQGYDWYQTRGNCNDFSYGSRGDIDWVIEIQSSNIPQAWNLNRDAILELIDAADIGLTGIVTDAYTGAPLAATVWVEEVYWPCFTDPKVGDYHRLLLPGSYTVHFRANGYEEQVYTVEITEESTVLDVALVRGDDRYAYQVSWCYIHDPYSYPNNYQNNPTEVISALGPPDGTYASLGVGGFVTLDMGVNGEIRNGSGPDFIVYEGDMVPEGYHVSVSQKGGWSGPWINVGSGTGTTSFDLEDGGIERARYVKIQDDSDGNQYENYPGFDLDAVQTLNSVQAAVLLLDGYCYVDMNPAENVTVNITNLDTGVVWQAETVGNYYSVELIPGEDVNASETLRFTALDNTSHVNVTDHVISETDLSIGNIHINLVLELGFVAADFDQDGDVDLNDFAKFAQCYAGAGRPPAPSCPGEMFEGGFCKADFDQDGDVDLNDFAKFAQCYAGAGRPPSPACPADMFE